MIYWHVRISPKNETSSTDYKKFVESVTVTGKGFWDNDTKNQIKSGDFIGFITGLSGNEQIHIYKIIDTLARDKRLSHWKSDEPYTIGNGINSVLHRNVIVLTNDHLLPKSYNWRIFRNYTKLGKDCYSWMPRGTEKVLNNESLPFYALM